MVWVPVLFCPLGSPPTPTRTDADVDIFRWSKITTWARKSKNQSKRIENVEIHRKLAKSIKKY